MVLTETRSLSPSQHGYLPRPSCLSNPILQEERVTRLLDEGHTVDLVNLDFAKAFGSVNHRFLLAKRKASGIDGAVPNRIKSYLSNRSYQAQFDGVLSVGASCHSGVFPRFSYWAIAFSVIHINDPPAALGDSAFLFADDVKMVYLL